MKILLNWLLFLGAIAGLYFGWGYIHLPTMPGLQAILFGLSLAFVWVEKLKWGVTKPFNCLGCMTGWFSVIIAFAFHTPFWYFYLPAGLLVGSIFSLIKGNL